MTINKKVILTCAVTGENQYNQAHPNFPITPQQIADAALEAEQAGPSSGALCWCWRLCGDPYL